MLSKGDVIVLCALIKAQEKDFDSAMELVEAACRADKYIVGDPTVEWWIKKHIYKIVDYLKRNGRSR